MRMTMNPILRPTLRGLVLALAVTATVQPSRPSRSLRLRRHQDGNTVSFILNQNAQGLVVLRDGANPVYPGTTAGTLSFDMTGYTSYQIIVTGNTARSGPSMCPTRHDTNFEYPFGVSINKNPASTNFGKVYVSNPGSARPVSAALLSTASTWCRRMVWTLVFETGGVGWTG